jgi:hypothetical protein
VKKGNAPVWPIGLLLMLLLIGLSTKFDNVVIPRTVAIPVFVVIGVLMIVFKYYILHVAAGRTEKGRQLQLRERVVRAVRGNK